MNCKIIDFTKHAELLKEKDRFKSIKELIEFNLPMEEILKYDYPQVKKSALNE